VEHNAGGVGIGTGRLRFHASLKRLQSRAVKKGSAALLIWLGKVHLGQREPAPATDEAGTFAWAWAALRRRRAERAEPQPEVESN
jgi:hypothetical protein